MLSIWYISLILFPAMLCLYNIFFLEMQHGDDCQLSLLPRTLTASQTKEQKNYKN